MKCYNSECDAYCARECSFDGKGTCLWLPSNRTDKCKDYIPEPPKLDDLGKMLTKIIDQGSLGYHADVLDYFKEINHRIKALEGK